MQRLGDICRNNTEDDRTNGRRRKSCQGIKKISDYRHAGVAADSRNHLGGQLYHICADRLISLLPEQWQPQYFWGFNIPGLGIIAAIVVLFLTGVFAANVLGRQILAAWDSLLGRIPVVKSIYSSVKKVSESLLSDSSRSFRTPVLVPFPQPNIWTIAFVSGHIPDKLKGSLPHDDDYLSVYVPTTPNPTGGYYIMVKKSDVRELDMSVDEALKYVISLGMVMPDEVRVKVLAEHRSSGKTTITEQNN